MNGWVDELAAVLAERDIAVVRDAAFGARTTYRVGGTAAALIEIDDAQQLSAVVAASGEQRIVMMGQGSNTLVADDGFDGVVVVWDSTRSEDAVMFGSNDDTAFVSAGAGVRLPVLARRCVAAQWCGLEWMVGVPGSVGGAVRMNAGGHGSDVRDGLIDADIFNIRTGRQARVPVADLGLRFRGSALRDHHVVLAARFSLRSPIAHESGSCTDELAAIVKWRRDHQPGGQNAGSVFVNPGTESLSAGALIDSAGMRGFSIGSAAVSEKHGNFIQSRPGGSARDVVDVMCHVQDAVERSHGIVLRSEIRLVGFADDVVERFAVLDHYDVDASHIASAEARLESLL